MKRRLLRLTTFTVVFAAVWYFLGALVGANSATGVVLLVVAWGLVGTLVTFWD